MNDAAIPNHLPRGRACQACRMRKMKCDGNPPVCNQCVRFHRESECVFVPGPAPSNTRMLEHEINRLQTKIMQLESRRGAASSTAPTAASVSPSVNFPPNWWESQDPPRAVFQTLLQYFRRHASKFGFFLDPQRVLRNAVYLWGIHLTRQPDVMYYESLYLDRAVRSVQEALSVTPQRPGTAISIIQTEILLAYYFFDCNRVVEGQVHANGAVSLALACGLHKIEPGRHAADSLLPPPADPTEEQERVNAWWHVFMLEKLWTTALETPSVITEDRGPDSVVDTPWPRDQHGYHSPYGRTVKNFLANVNSDRSCALLALLAKSAALYEKAAYIACLRSRNTPDVPAMVASLDTSIEHFKRSLPGLNNLRSSSIAIRHDLIAIHTVTECASIALHRGFLRQSNTSRTRCLTAANAVVRVFQTLNYQELEYVNPILAVNCYNAHDVLLSALRSLRSSPNSGSGAPGEDVLLFGMDVLKNTLSAFAANSALSVAYLRKLRDAQASLR